MSNFLVEEDQYYADPKVEILPPKSIRSDEMQLVSAPRVISERSLLNGKFLNLSLSKIEVFEGEKLPRWFRLERLLLFLLVGMLFYCNAFTLKALSFPFSYETKLRSLEEDLENLTKVTSFLVDKEVSKSTPTKTDIALGGALEPVKIALVTSSRANLRTGPGLHFPKAADVLLGTELFIVGERDQWLNVLSPVGERVWINSELVKIGLNHELSGSTS